ncbi:hypothetical protein D9M69_727090 [compost metagenome]
MGKDRVDTVALRIVLPFLPDHLTIAISHIIADDHEYAIQRDRDGAACIVTMDF